MGIVLPHILKIKVRSSTGKKDISPCEILGGIVHPSYTHAQRGIFNFTSYAMWVIWNRNTSNKVTFITSSSGPLYQIVKKMDERFSVSDHIQYKFM